MLCQSVRSCRVPLLSANDSLVAIEKLVTEEPELVKRVSGSRPRLPTRITLFTDAAIFSTSSSEKASLAPFSRQGGFATSVNSGFHGPPITDIIRLGAEAGEGDGGKHFHDRAGPHRGPWRARRDRSQSDGDRMR